MKIKDARGFTDKSETCEFSLESIFLAARVVLPKFFPPPFTSAAALSIGSTNPCKFVDFSRSLLRFEQHIYGSRLARRRETFSRKIGVIRTIYESTTVDRDARARVSKISYEKRTQIAGEANHGNRMLIVPREKCTGLFSKSLL